VDNLPRFRAGRTQKENRPALRADLCRVKTKRNWPSANDSSLSREIALCPAIWGLIWNFEQAYENASLALYRH
jgi:hypothetical protein